MPVNATARKILSDLVKGVSSIAEDIAVRLNHDTVGVEGSGDVDNIGIPLLWDETASAFLEFVANLDRVDSTAYSVGDIVKLDTQDGNEYVCTTAGTSDSSEGTFNTVIGSETTDNTAVWTARKAYSMDSVGTTPLKNKSRVAVTVGSALGVGFNSSDTTLSATPANMTVLFRGDAAIAVEGIDFGAVVSADQAEFLSALEDVGITVVDNAEVVSPTFTS